MRAGDDAVQRQRLLQRRQHHATTPPARRRPAPASTRETVTSGAEIALWVWQQYQDTGDISFLQKYYPMLQQTSTFLLAWQSVGSDGYLHAMANAHETQWAVPDPTTDIAADQALFTATVNAATLLNTDSALVSQLRTRAGADPAVCAHRPGHATASCSARPRTPSGHRRDRQLLPADRGDAQRGEHRPGAGVAVRGDRRQHRGQRGQPDRAGPAHLHAPAVREQPGLDLRLGAGRAAGPGHRGRQRPGRQHQELPGVHLRAGRVEPRHAGRALHRAGLERGRHRRRGAGQDYDGTLRFAPAWPSGWDGSGTVAIQGGSKVDVQVEGGTLATAAIQAGSTRR